jgi:riboflavin biosynthesis pyrimidine reductase
MYEVLLAWETLDLTDEPSHIRDYAAIWRGADKIVYSTTLKAASSTRTRIAPTFDTAEIREMKASAVGDLSVGGPTLAAEAFKSGLVDECHLLLAPVIVGGGLPALPDGLRVDLELLDERRFRSGFVHLHYRTAA